MNLATKIEKMEVTGPGEIKLDIQKNQSTDNEIENPPPQDLQEAQEEYMTIQGLAPFGDVGPREMKKRNFGKFSHRKEKQLKEADGQIIPLDMKYNSSKTGLDGTQYRGSVINFIEESFKYTDKRPKNRPRLPRKQLIMTIILVVVGMILLLIGTIHAANTHKSSNGLAFWIIGALCGLPGLYYSVKFCRVCYAKSVEDQRKALEEIPQE